MDFVEKLWSLLSKSSPDTGIRWSERVKNAIEIDLNNFEVTLVQQPVLFNTIDVFNFLYQLNENGFKRLPRDPSELLSNVFRFQSDNFKRNEPELLKNIPRNVSDGTTRTGKLTGQMKPETSVQSSVADRITGKATLDNIKLKITSKMFVLENELEKQKTELSANLFANAKDNISTLQQNSYAGFYGFFSEDVIEKFFGNYLPIFQSENGTMPKSQYQSRNFFVVFTSFAKFFLICTSSITK